MATAIRLETLPPVRAPHRPRPPVLHWATRNRGLHWARNVTRVVLLAASDLGAVWTLGALVEIVRDHARLGMGAVAWLQSLPAPGALGGWHFALALLFALTVTGTYRPRPHAGRIVAAVLVAALMLWYRELWVQAAAGWQLAAVVGTVGPTLALSRALVNRWAAHVTPGVAPSRVVVIGGGPRDWTDLAGWATDNGAADAPRRIVATVAANGRQPSQGIGRLPWVIDETQADTLLIAGPLGDRAFAFVADTALASGCRLLAAPRTSEAAGIEPRTVWEGGTRLVELTAPGRQASYLVAKRVLDFCLSSVALLLLSPLFALIGALVRWESPGPAIFAHWRLGAQGRMFRCYKFRSMRRDAEQVLRADPELHQLYVDNGYKLPAHLDPRLTRVGRFLRKCSLDELPQLFNVLLGDMSLVGPRPIVTDELSQYPKTASLFLSRKPGITGNWAAHGRSDIGYPDRADVEVAYARQWSLLHDLGLILRTIPAVAGRRGAH